MGTPDATTTLLAHAAGAAGAAGAAHWCCRCVPALADCPEIASSHHRYHVKFSDINLFQTEQGNATADTLACTYDGGQSHRRH